MRVAFYAPMKPPDHPLPSGDRRMARAVRRRLLAGLGTRSSWPAASAATTATAIRRDSSGSAALGARLAARLLRRYRRGRRAAAGALVHLPPLSQGAGLARAGGQPARSASPMSWPRPRSPASRRAGAWAAGYAASQRGDRPGRSRPGDDAKPICRARRCRRRAGATRLFPPFLDAGPFAAAARPRRGAGRCSQPLWRLDPGLPWLLAVAMMRADAKRALLPAARRALGTAWPTCPGGCSSSATARRAARWRRCSRRFGERVRLAGRLARGGTAEPLCGCRPLCLAGLQRGLRHGAARGAGGRPAGGGRARGRRRRMSSSWTASPGCSSRRADRRRMAPPSLRCSWTRRGGGDGSRRRRRGSLARA